MSTDPGFGPTFAPAARRSRGFTLIEVMIVVAIVAILAAIAIPSYRDYILRGQLVDATNLLSAGRANMERYFQDNRTYVGADAASKPCNGTLGYFTMSCLAAPNPAGYTLTATGNGPVSGFVYTVDQTDSRTTTISSPAPWPSGTFNCYVVKKGQTC